MVRKEAGWRPAGLEALKELEVGKNTIHSLIIFFDKQSDLYIIHSKFFGEKFEAILS